MRAVVLAVLTVAAVLASASAAPFDCPNTLRISVLKDGSILVGGAKSTDHALDRKLSELEKANGEVWYYREGAEGDATRKQDASVKVVLDLVIKHGRPISFSSKPDFSDFIDGEGRMAPRTKC